MKKFSLFLAICLMFLGVLFSGLKQPLFAKEDYSYYVEQSSFDNKTNMLTTKVYTNNENTKQNLINKGFVYSDNEQMLTKTEDAKSDQGLLKTSTNFENTFNEIFELQNQMFNKIHNLFNSLEGNSTLNSSSVENNKQEELKQNNENKDYLDNIQNKDNLENKEIAQLHEDNNIKSNISQDNKTNTNLNQNSKETNLEKKETVLEEKEYDTFKLDNTKNITKNSPKNINSKNNINKQNKAKTLTENSIN